MSEPNSSEPASDNRQLVVYDAEENSRRPIPDRWRLVKGNRKDGSEFSYYICPETRQRFSSYENLMRYVHYAEVAMVSIYSPYFQSKPRKGDVPTDCVLVTGPSSERPGSDGIDYKSCNDASSDSEDFSFLENISIEDELTPIPDMYALPPMDSIVLLPIESDQKEKNNKTAARGKSRRCNVRPKKPGSKNKTLTRRLTAPGFTTKGKRTLRKRREDNLHLLMN